jgi:insertion element IS1 protein InsB
MIVRDACPACGSTRFKKNGHTHNGKQKHQRKTCPRQFVQCLDQYRISAETRALIERLLVERISLRGICRAVGVGLKWLLGFLVTCFEALPDHLHVQPVTGHGDVMLRRLEVEADEMASFVQKKANTCPEGGCQGVFTVVQGAFARRWSSDEPRRLSARR